MTGLFLEGVSVDQLREIMRQEVQSALGTLQRSSPSKLLTYREVESRFGIKRNRLYQLNNAGVLFYLKEGRKTVWRESDVQSYANQLRATG